MAKQDYLSIEELERFNQLIPGQESECWSALERMALHLDENIVKVAHHEFGDRGAAKLTVFRPHGPEDPDLYLLVTSQGRVHLGRTDQLGAPTTLELEDYNSHWDEVGTVLVTDKMRFGGSFFDILIVVHRNRENEAAEDVVYHGEATLEANQLYLRPVLDRPDQSRERWLPIKPDRLPQWLRTWNFQPAYSMSPHEPLSDVYTNLLKRLDELQNGQIDGVMITEKRICVVQADELVLCNAQGEEHNLKLRDWLKAAAIRENHEGGQILTACDDRKLLGYPGLENSLPLFRQICHDTIAAVAFCGPEESETGWPDFVVFFYDGTLERLRYLPCGKLQNTWNRQWQNLGLDTLAKKQARMTELMTIKLPQQRLALVRAVLDHYINVAAMQGVSPAPADHILSWLEPEESDELQLMVADYFLVRARRCKRQWDQKREEGINLFASLYEFYHRRFRISVQDRVDRYFRSIDFSDDDSKNETIEVLKWRATRNRNQLWRESENFKEFPASQIRLELACWRGKLAMERWVNVFWLADSVIDEISKKNALVGTAHLGGFGTQTILIFATRHEYFHIPIDCESHRLLCDKETKSQPVRLPEDQILRIEKIAELNMVIAGISGNLYFFEWANNNLKQVQVLKPELPGAAWALASISINGINHVFAAYNKGRICQLYHATDEDGKWRQQQILSLSLPKVRFLAVASDGGDGFILAKASTFASACSIIHFNAHGIIEGGKHSTELPTGITAVCFDKQVGPEHCLVSDRLGMVQCLKLFSPKPNSLPPAQTVKAELIWAYKCKGAIRSICSYTHDNEEHFVIGSEMGELALLKAKNGRRIWKKILKYPIRMVRNLNEKYLSVNQTEGLISLFKYIQGPKKDALIEARSVINWIEKNTEGKTERENKIWCFSDNNSLQVLFKLERVGRDYEYVLDRFHTKEPRGRIMAHIVNVSDRPGDILKDVKKHLTFRDLYLLTSYLQEDAPKKLFLSIWHELVKKPKAEHSGNNSPAARMAAFSVCLQRLNIFPWSLDDALELQLPQDLFAEPWPCFEYSRLLLCCIPENKRYTSTQFQELLPYLFRLPPTVAEAISRLSPAESEGRNDLILFLTMCHNLIHGKLEETDFTSLQFLFLPFASEKSITGVFYWSAVLTRLYMRIKESTAWNNERNSFFEALEKIHHLVTQIRASEGPSEYLAGLLRNMLLVEPPPQHDLPLREQHQWWEQFLTRLNQAQLNADKKDAWCEEVGHLAVHLKRVLALLVVKEQEHLNSEVRACPEILDLNKRYTGQVEIRLRLHPEGQASLKDASLIIDASGESGLRSPGTNKVELRRTNYPGEFPKIDLTMLGFLAGNQTSLALTTAIVGKDYSQRQTSWNLDLKRFLHNLSDDLNLTQRFPKAYAYVLEHMALPQTGTTLVFVDDTAVQRKMAHDWCHTNGGLHVALDDLLKHIGPGTSYSNPEQDLQQILEILREHIAESLKAHGLKEQTSPICLAPMSQFVDRCHQHRSHLLLDQLWQYFLSNSTDRQRRWVLILDNSVAKEFKNQTQAEMVFVHRLLRKVYRNAQLPELQRELEQEIVKTIKGSNQTLDANQVLRRFNWDIRLFFQWFDYNRRTEVKKRSFAGFDSSKHLTQLLLSDLSELSVEALLVMLVGSVANARVELKQLKAGMYMAEDLFSYLADGKLSKKIVDNGSLLQEHDLNTIRSIRTTAKSIQIEAYGIGGPISDDYGLWELTHKILGAQTQNTYQTLEQKGLIEWQTPWLRTISPYREYLAKLLDEHKTASDPVGMVFRTVLGTKRNPLENTNFSNLHQLQDVSIRIGLATKRDLNRLLNIRQYWQTKNHPSQQENFQRELDLKHASIASDVFKPLVGLPISVFLRDFVSQPGSFWCWLEPHTKVSMLDVVETCRTVLSQFMESGAKGLNPISREKHRFFPRIVAFGPGAEALEPDPEHRFAIIKQIHFMQSLYEGDLLAGLLSCANNQMKLTAISPFQLAGPLPPGSPLFKGRDEELSFIKQNIRNLSTLIVGSRQVGKTSFLNQLLHWARQEPGICPIYIDLQTVETAAQFNRALAYSAQTPNNNHLRQYDPPELGMPNQLEDYTEWFQAKSLLPVFLFNEVDNLVEKAPEVTQAWRALNEVGSARFIMVGYATLLRLDDAKSAFFHFTHGSAKGLKAITLTALSKSAADDLLNLLESKELGLSWVSIEQKIRAHELCCQRSFRIPWVLQKLGHLILQSVQDRRETQLSYDLVETALAQGGDVVWHYIGSIDYRSIGLAGSQADNCGFKLITYALVRHKYLLGNSPPIEDPKLFFRDVLDPKLSFTINEAHKILFELMNQLLIGSEHERLRTWIMALNLDNVLKIMTLTLVFVPDPKDALRYGFLMHILPWELRNHYPNDLTLDLLIIEEATTFIELTKADRERQWSTNLEK